MLTRIIMSLLYHKQFIRAIKLFIYQVYLASNTESFISLFLLSGSTLWRQKLWVQTITINSNLKFSIITEVVKSKLYKTGVAFKENTEKISLSLINPIS